MTDIGDLVDELIASGAAPSAAARIVAQAYVAGASLTDKRSSSAIRQQRYRDRKNDRNEASQNVTKHNDVTDEVAMSATKRNVVTPDAKTVSLSPIPLLPPTPPNNPLTPKPIQKNNKRGHRLPADWTMSGPDLAYALGKGLSEREAGELFERFCSWAWSASGPNAIKVNWHQAWQGWVQRDGPKIIAARAGPIGKPLTAFQQRRQETKDILDGLDNFARNGSQSSETYPRILPGHSGQ